MVTPRAPRSHEGAARRNNLLIRLLISAAACSCSGRAAIENDIGVAATTSAASAAVAASHPKTIIKTGEASAATSSAASSLLGKERSTTEGRKVDLSFSHMGHGRHLPDLAAVIGLSPSSEAGDSDQQQQESDAPLHDDDNSSVALGLRECSLGDEGVAEIARSPWVTGSLGVRALSLRHNQVGAHTLSICGICGNNGRTGYLLPGNVFVRKVRGTGYG